MSRWIVSINNNPLDAKDLGTDGQSADSVPDAMISRSLEEGSPPLDIATIKDFLRFKASVSEGRIDKERERTTPDSLNAFAEWFFAGFARVSGNPIPKEDKQEVYDVSAPRLEQRDPC